MENSIIAHGGGGSESSEWPLYSSAAAYSNLAADRHRAEYGHHGQQQMGASRSATPDYSYACAERPAASAASAFDPASAHYNWTGAARQANREELPGWSCASVASPPSSTSSSWSAAENSYQTHYLGAMHASFANEGVSGAHLASTYMDESGADFCYSYPYYSGPRHCGLSDVCIRSEMNADDPEEDKDLLCEGRQASFVHQRSLADHQARLSRSPPSCASGASTRSSGRRSSPDSSTADNNKNVCNICGKTYARPSTLKTHLRTHSGERPYRCFSCAKSFSQAANLTAHCRTHSGEKPFRCSVCSRSFSQSSSVTTHLRTHSGERPYKCGLCKKAFSDSSTLTKHLRIHSGEKPYACALCNLRFSQSGNLNRHMKIHALTAHN